MPHKIKFLPEKFGVIPGSPQEAEWVNRWFEKNGYKVREIRHYEIYVGTVLGIVNGDSIISAHIEDWMSYFPESCTLRYSAFKARLECDRLVKMWGSYMKIVPYFLSFALVIGFGFIGFWSICTTIVLAIGFWVLNYFFEKKTKILMSVK